MMHLVQFSSFVLHLIHFSCCGQLLKTTNPSDMVRPCSPPSAPEGNGNCNGSLSSTFSSAAELVDLEPDEENRLGIFYWLKDGELTPNENAITGNLISFVKSPVPIGVTLKCRITRYCDTINRKWFPSNTLAMENGVDNSNKMILMVSRERKKRLIGSILIQMSSSRPATAHSFDIRESMQESVESLDKPVTYREELASITYLPNPKSTDKKAREIKILLPMMENETERLEIQRIGGNHNLAKCTNGPLHGVMEFWSKDFDNEDEVSVKEEDENDDLQKAQPIEFKSIKNFQIVHAEQDDYIILESGRLSDHEFSLEIRVPLYPLQAFGIDLSSFSKRRMILG